MRAVTPFAACWFTSAPAAISSSVTWVGAFDTTAAIRGVSPASLRACTSAPPAIAAATCAASPDSMTGKIAGTGGGAGSRGPKGGSPKAVRPPRTRTATSSAATSTRMPRCYQPLGRGYRVRMPHRVVRELVALLTVAGPLVLAQLAQNGMSFIDTVMVGRLGPGPLAGLALGAVAFNFAYLLAMALLLSVSPVVAQAVGGGRHEVAARALRHGLVLAVALAVPLSLVVAHLAPVLGRLGQAAPVRVGASEYLRAVARGAFGALACVALRGFLEGNGQTRPVMVIALLGVALNAALNEVLIFGRLGLPRLGVAGAGVATSVTYLA